MAYYNYKRVRDAIPDDFQDEWEKKYKEESDCEYEGTMLATHADLWILAADYIQHLKEECERLERNQCTVEERKVLEACAALDLGGCKLDEDGLTGNEVEAIVEAELARREAEHAKGEIF